MKFAKTNRGSKVSQQGFSLIEVMISMVIMTVGLVSLLGVFGLAMASTQTSQQTAVAKQLANEALEGILTAREPTTSRGIKSRTPEAVVFSWEARNRLTAPAWMASSEPPMTPPAACRN